MTEREWLGGEDPQAMLRLYTSDAMPWPPGTEAPAVSGRKLRLFAAASLRLLLSRARGAAASWLPRLREGAAAAEAVADGRAVRPHPVRDVHPLADLPEDAALACVRDHHLVAPAEHAALLREILGDPFRPVPGVTPGRPWLAPQVLTLAQAAYEERPGRECETCQGAGDGCPACQGTGRAPGGPLDPLRLMILADALEEAGCDSEPILLHLRSADRRADGSDGTTSGAECLPVTHVLGCWALDLVLGKE